MGGRRVTKKKKLGKKGGFSPVSVANSVVAQRTIFFFFLVVGVANAKLGLDNIDNPLVLLVHLDYQNLVSWVSHHGKE